jgi:hypothetical protein
LLVAPIKNNFGGKQKSYSKILVMDNTKNISIKFGFYASLSLSILTILTFGFAMIAIPPAGPNCPGNCMEYPFSDLLLYYSRDYNWMYLAFFQLLAFLFFVVSIHHIASVEKKILSFIGVAFGLISTSVLLITYYVQFSVVPISMMKGETEGIALITQYNGHGVFIALEELGYIMMSLAFLFLAPVFTKTNRLEKSIRWILFLPFVLVVLSFVLYSFKYGIDRNYRFEVAAITINFLFMITAGILVGIFFKRLMKEKIS